MEEAFSRIEQLIGSQAMSKLEKSRVAVLGVGGVGGHVIEALVRSGLGTIDIVDNDTVTLSNLNRQIIATHSTLGQSKVEVAKTRLLDINPKVTVNTYEIFYTPETSGMFDFSQYDYVVDAIDTVSGKLSLIEQAKKHNVPIICAMGAGNKLDATKFEVADISKTSVCPLARVIRTELKKRKISKVKVVYSKEPPIKPPKPKETRQATGSTAFVPAVAGLIIAGEVIKDLIKQV